MRTSSWPTSTRASPRSEPLHDDLALGGDVAPQVPVHLGTADAEPFVTDADVLEPVVLVEGPGVPGLSRVHASERADGGVGVLPGHGDE
ncbi:hypothetical protein Q9Q99_00350 [Curtobacterium flaccumfaciens]|nr:hypothetical protein Q9Q99_00350 [Curtobacterium flaccumfaciens]